MIDPILIMTNHKFIVNIIIIMILLNHDQKHSADGKVGDPEKEWARHFITTGFIALEQVLCFASIKYLGNPSSTKSDVFYTLCKRPLTPPPLLVFTQSCCGFFDMNVKKCVNVCCDKI